MAKIAHKIIVNTNVKIERGTLIKDTATHFIYEENNCKYVEQNLPRQFVISTKCIQAKIVKE